MKLRYFSALLLVLSLGSCASGTSTSDLEARFTQQQERLNKLEQENKSLAAKLEKHGLRIQEIYEEKASYDKTQELEARLSRDEDAINKVGRMAQSGSHYAANHYNY